MRYAIAGLFYLLSMPILANDFSGVYDCNGQDAHAGAYQGKVTLKRIAQHSTAEYVSYDFQLAVPEYGTYLGHAAAKGNVVAMHFALPMEDGLYGGKTQDFGTGIAEFKQVEGKWIFKKFYFEPHYQGGNTGVETCTQR